jgi:hypothetical protein
MMCGCVYACRLSPCHIHFALLQYFTRYRRQTERNSKILHYRCVILCSANRNTFKSLQFSMASYYTSFLVRELISTTVSSTSHVRVPAMLLLLFVGNQGVAW